MKKFFVIFMSCVLLFSLLLPFGVHAAEDDTTDIIFDQTISMSSVRSSWEMDAQGRYCINGDFVYAGLSYNKMYFHATNNNFYVSSPTSGTFVSGTYNSDDDTFTFTGVFVITIIGDKFGSDRVQSWLDENTTFKIKVCDGTECDWADDDYNGVCDTCGFALMSFRYDLYQFAKDHLASGQELFPNAQYWLITEAVIFPSTEKMYYIYLSETPFKYDGGIYTDGANYRVTHVQLRDDGVPTYTGWRETAGSVITKVDTPVEVSHNIDGFFPLSLQQKVEVVVTEGLLEVIRKTAGTMTILMGCGVGLMACLVVLSLFGKRSLISR